MDWEKRTFFSTRSELSDLLGLLGLLGFATGDIGRHHFEVLGEIPSG